MTAPAPTTTAPRTTEDTTVDTPLLLTVEQAAQRMNMSPRYVRRLIAGRRIAFHRIGRAVRLTVADVDAFVAAGRVEPLTSSDAWRGVRGVA
jgi:excisionase family DNA binding protein